MQASRTELYDISDIDLLGSKRPVKRKDRHRKDIIRKCYRVSKRFMDSIPEDILDVCGYSTWQSWHDACLKRLLGEYAARMKGRKK